MATLYLGPLEDGLASVIPGDKAFPLQPLSTRLHLRLHVVLEDTGIALDQIPYLHTAVRAIKGETGSQATSGYLHRRNAGSTSRKKRQMYSDTSSPL